MDSAESSRAAGVAPLVELKGIVKRYPGVVALGGVSLSVGPGEVVALIGENGAGKSTLMKVLGGLVKPDEGEILIDGTSARLSSAAESAARGIALIHQELNPLDNLDVAGNVYLGREPRRFGLLDRAKMREDARAVLARLGLNVSPDAPMAGLALAERQMVEIAKALSTNARVLILDEPTSSLTLSETARLLDLMRDLRAKGVGMVYVSHRLGEVREIADRVVALRDGQNAGRLDREEVTHDAMVRLMVGRDIFAEDRESVAFTGEPRLKVTGLRTRRYPDREVSFSVAPGEVLGLAGLIGAGRSEIAETIFGALPAMGGAVELDGARVPLGSPKRAIAAGIGLVPEDRRGTGLLVEWPIGGNVTLPTLSRWSSGGLIKRGLERSKAQAEADAIGVKAPSVDVAAAALSGGNQQKVVLGKWLLAGPRALLLDEPTRGVDVGAKAEIYAIIRRLAGEGVAIVMVSSDMEEVLSQSDRVAVMHEGSLAGVLDRGDATEESVMALAVGGERAGGAR